MGHGDQGETCDPSEICSALWNPPEEVCEAEFHMASISRGRNGRSGPALAGLSFFTAYLILQVVEIDHLIGISLNIPLYDR